MYGMKNKASLRSASKNEEVKMKNEELFCIIYKNAFVCKTTALAPSTLGLLSAIESEAVCSLFNYVL